MVIQIAEGPSTSNSTKVISSYNNVTQASILTVFSQLISWISRVQVYGLDEEEFVCIKGIGFSTECRYDVNKLSINK